MSNRVFISHSATGEPETERLRDELSAALREEFDVRLDRDNLEPGEMWRSKINSWLGGCHAAVVLLTRKALASAFVAYEVSVLTYRRDVIVIPVFLDDVDDAAVRASRLSPTVIQERQSIVESRSIDTSGWGALGEEEIARYKRSKLVGLIKDALLAKKGKMGGSTPIDKQVERVVANLASATSTRGLTPKMLNDYMEKLDPDHDSWEQDDDLNYKLAHKLMSAGVAVITPLLGDMIDDFGLMTVLDIFERVATSWVDPRAAEHIKDTALANEVARRVLATNGEKTLIAKLYVQRASGRSFSNNWNVAESAGVFSEQVFDTLKANVESALMAQLGNLPTTEALKKELKSIEKLRREPVFVTLPAEGVNITVMNELRKAFPTVTFFFLAGRKQVNRDSLSLVNVEFIIPELEEDFEEDFCDVYDYIKEDFHKRLRQG